MYDEKNTDCLLYGTEECSMLNPEGCLNCRVGRMKPEAQAELRESLRLMNEAAPVELVETLYETDKCVFCKDEPAGDVGCYALFDMSKEEETVSGWAALFNKAASKKAGVNVLPLQAACCKNCRARYRRMEFIPTIVALIIAAAGLVLTTNKAVYAQAYNVKPWLPAAIFAGFVIAALVIRFVLRRSFAAAAEKHTHINVEELPQIRTLMENGWQVTEKPKAGASALVYARKLREHGIYTHSDKADED